jgi:hypothetical protein
MRRLIVVGLTSLGILFGRSGTALATHCYVADKPDGVGTNGAFQRESDPVDTFQAEGEIRIDGEVAIRRVARAGVTGAGGDDAGRAATCLSPSRLFDFRGVPLAS